MEYNYGRNVLITGGSSGIGRRAAELYARNGYKVFACSRSGSGNTEICSDGGEIYSAKMDVCDEESVHHGVSEMISRLGSIDIVVHCAGFGITGAAADTSDSAARRQMETNYFGVLNVNRQILPHMCHRHNGLVIIVSSVAGIFPIPYQAHYSSSKFALEAYGSVLQMELRNMHVNVALIEPGPTKTGFTAARDFEIDAGSLFYEDCMRAVTRMENDEKVGDSPSMAAQCMFKLAERANPPLHNVIGLNYKLQVLLKRILPNRAVLWMLRKKYRL